MVRVLMKLATGALSLWGIYAFTRHVFLPLVRRSLEGRRKEKLAAERYQRIIGMSSEDKCVLCERPEPDCLDKKNGTRFHENCLTALMKGRP